MTPRSEQADNIISRCLQKDPGPAALGRFGDVPHHHYTHDPKSGLALFDAKDMSKHNYATWQSLEVYCAPIFSVARLLRVGYYSSSRSEWVQPELVTESQSQSKSNMFHVSVIVAIPFINLNPSYMSTNAALIFAQKEASLFNRSYCIVTFDQPLFIKAVDIVHANAELCDSVIVRLGGLHMTFSYTGSDGYITSGSGQEQMWSTAYAEGSIPQVMSGHSYPRALRAHIFSVQSIASVLLSAPGVLYQVYAVAIHRTWYDLLHENIALEDALSTKEVFQVAHIMEQEIEKVRYRENLVEQPSYGFST